MIDYPYVNPQISVRRANSTVESHLGQSANGRYIIPPMPRRNGYSQNQQQQHVEYNEGIKKIPDDEEVRALKEQLEMAQQAIQKQAHENKILIFQQRLQLEQTEPVQLQQLFERSTSVPRPYLQKTPSHYSVVSDLSNSSAVISTLSAAVNGSNIPSSNALHATSIASKTSEKASNMSSRTTLKSVSGWTGKSNVRYPNEISDIIIDEICNFEEYPIFPQHIAVKCIMKVKEYYYQSSGKGDGANMAIMAILYVCDLADPEFTRRGLETLEFFYATAGVLFWASVSLNLNFWVHFLEHRMFLTEAEKAIAKPMTPFEKDNVKFLCRIFASWYLVDASKQELEAAGNIQDPTVFIKNFFEALYRAGYEFPPESINHIPVDKIKAITAWSFKKPPFTLNKV
ncbi:hypothetical protein HK100_002501 [Physocladia obscura]|uniref:Uncharacterized protein n=1 Tax=Physocladia obscura TaxID=109957 RepID=A0AAD5SVN9_9FUNG|nr:hypothetical protein HK100_002501 [Physocladia obscura]